MDWRKLTLVVWIGGLSVTLSASAPVVSISAPCISIDCNISQSLADQGLVTVRDKNPSLQLTMFKGGKLYSQAQSITVKVLSTDFLGSGILLRKKGRIYTVLTNAHVLQAGDRPYRIQTPDGSIYRANLPKKSNFGKNDLALLQFQSDRTVYATASFGASPSVGDEVFAAGFAAAEEESQVKNLAFTKGKVSLILPKPLEGGYQLGYTNNLEKGMSGGPLLNRRGEVVGVNGMQAYPLWDAPSLFEDGLEVNQPLHKKIIRLSWAVPIEKVVQIMQKSINTRDFAVLTQAD